MLVEIVWYDAASDDAIYSKEEVETFKPITRRNVGYLLKDDGDYITITYGEIDFEEKRYDHPLSIPKSMITGILRLGSSQEIPDNKNTKIDYI